ncbi:MAG: hypothetical protein IPK77_09720 [Cellvibrio sp.]|nr:hypothetical protein [Cellvibrio sp.]
MTKLTEIFNLLRAEFCEESINWYSRLQEKSVLMTEIISDGRTISTEETDLVRFNFLNIIDVVCAGTNNSEEISRRVSDHKIVSTLKSVVQGDPDSRIGTLNQLPFVGERSAVAVLAFLYPEDYAIVNRGILTFLQVTNEEFRNTRLPDDLTWSSKIVGLSRSLCCQSSLVFSLQILMAVEKIMTTDVKQIPKKLCFEEKLEYKLNWILNESKNTAPEIIS